MPKAESRTTSTEKTPEDLLKLREQLESWQGSLDYEPLIRIDPWTKRYVVGERAQKEIPYSTHSKWKKAKNRPDPVDMVVGTNVGRQEHLVPIRMGRMAANPFAFLRGSAGVMAWDLAQTPDLGFLVFAIGDAHLNNFGLYGTPQRTVVFDVDDFDECAIGPWEWDLKRLTASVNVAGRENGLSKGARREAVLACVSGYVENARRLAEMPIMQVWYLHHYPGEANPVFQPDAKTKKVLDKAVAKAKKKTNVTLLNKIAHRSVGGSWRFNDDPPILERTDIKTGEKVIESLVEYAANLPIHRSFMLRRYRVVDVAHRIVGVGSVGLRAYLVMLFGNDDSDPLFLQVKEATQSVLAPFTAPFRETHQGKRVVLGQTATQSANDVMLGYTSIEGRPFYVRQMKNMKGSIPIEWLKGSAFRMYARACGTLLARAHSRSGDIAKIAGYCGEEMSFHEAIGDFAEAYGNQTERDHEVLLKAIKSGKVAAEMGV